MKIHKLSLCISLALASMVAGADTPAVLDQDKVVITGNRLDQAITDVSGSVTVIDSAEIDALQATNTGDLLDHTPGVEIVKDSRYGIKSVNIRGLEGNYVKIKVDNVNAPAEFSSGRNLIASSRLNLDIDMVKSVEVIRGPSSTTQGSDALGGSVLFTTKDASDFIDGDEGFGGHAKVLYDDSTSGFRESLALAYRSAHFDTVLGLSAANFDGADDYKMNFKESNKPKSGLLKSTWFINDDHSLGLSLDWNRTESFADPDNETDNKYQYTKDTSKRFRYGVRYEGQLNAALVDNLSVQLDWQEKDQIARTYRYVPANPRWYVFTPKGELKNYTYNEQGKTLDIQLNKSLATGNLTHKIAYGLTYSDIDYSNVNMTYYDRNFDGVYADGSKLFYYIPSSSAKTYGVYLLDELSFMDGQLLLTPGVRYDKFKQNPFNVDPSQSGVPVSGYSSTNSYQPYSESEVTFKLGVIYRLNQQNSVFAQYSQGFKAPDFNQLYYSYSNDRVGYKTRPNPNLKAEFSDSYELGLRHNSRKVKFEGSVFYSKYDDFIAKVTDYTDPSFRRGVDYNVNIKEATIKGVDLAASFDTSDFVSGSSVKMSLSRVKGEDGKGNTLSSVAPWSAAMSLSYDSPSDFWGTSLRIRHYSSAHKNDYPAGSQATPGSTSVADLTAYIRPIPDLTFRAGIQNLTDEKWYRWTNLNGVKSNANLDEYAEAKRSFTLSAKYTF